MTQQAITTITGCLGADPVPFGKDSGATACSFRLGSTRRYYHTPTKAWCDRPTTWITVKAFRSLAANILDSLHKGDPVIVAGLLNTDEWEQDGQRKSRLVLEASTVGHDLNRGRGVFTRVFPNAMGSSIEIPAGNASSDGGSCDRSLASGTVGGDPWDNDRSEPENDLHTSDFGGMRKKESGDTSTPGCGLRQTKQQTAASNRSSDHEEFPDANI